jgi:hypothetical protein
MESGPKAVKQEQEFKKVDDLAGGGPTQDGNADVLKPFCRGQLPPQRLALHQDFIDGADVRIQHG